MAAVAGGAVADPACLPDCNGENLIGRDLRFANMAGASLRGAALTIANAARADLSGADLSFANLSRADLEEAYPKYPRPAECPRLTGSQQIAEPEKVKKRRFVIAAASLPNLPGMMLSVIEALKDLGGSATNQELNEKVIELEGVTEAEQTFTMRQNENLSRVNFYLAWARTYLKRGNAIANSSRGVWALTEIGVAITDEETHAIYEKVTLEERDRARSKRQAAKKVDPDDEDSEEAYDWKSSLLATLGAMPPDAFERLSQRLLREAGFTKVEVRGKSGDGGIDGVGVLRVSLVSFQVYFQCKRWKGNVGATEIRNFRGALQGSADKGLFITTSHFSNQASAEATRPGAIPIDLIDGDRLCDLLKNNRLGVEIEMVESVGIQSDWFENI